MRDATAQIGYGRAIRSTEAAVLVDIGTEEIWVPRSQIVEESEIQDDGDEGELWTTEWWAKQRGLI